jgi:hypothetical protein
MKEIQLEIRERDRKLWLVDHPGMTARDYRRVEDTEEVREWRGRRNEAAMADMRRGWQRDHGTPYPEHECDMPERQHRAFVRWQRAYTRQLLASRRRAR